MDVTLSRSGTSIDIPVVSDGSGSPLVSSDLGKPELSLYATGALFQRHLDSWSQLENYTILGRFYSDSAYTDARTLADLLLSHSQQNDLTLDIPLDEYPNPVTVAPSAGSDQAASIVYNPGRRDWVEVDIGLTRVNNTIASDDTGDTNHQASTPTASGSGPIELSDGSTTVQISDGVTVERAVGRPNSTVRRTPFRYPNYIDKRKPASDSWELSYRITDASTGEISDIRSLFNSKLVRSSLKLRFNGVYGLGTFNVVPNGSQALRHQRLSGFQGTANVPAISLQRVFSG